MLFLLPKSTANLGVIKTDRENFANEQCKPGPIVLFLFPRAAEKAMRGQWIPKPAF
jgi:hypothetical protein